MSPQLCIADKHRAPVGLYSTMLIFRLHLFLGILVAFAFPQAIEDSQRALIAASQRTLSDYVEQAHQAPPNQLHSQPAAPMQLQSQTVSPPPPSTALSRWGSRFSQLSSKVGRLATQIWPLHHHHLDNLSPDVLDTLKRRVNRKALFQDKCVSLFHTNSS